MPRLVKVDKLQYVGFTSLAKDLGFSLVGSKEESRQLQLLGISSSQPPRSQNGKGDVLIYYTRNGYRVVVQTSISTAPFKMLKNPGWVLIENEYGKSVFYAPPLHRTKNFLINLLNQMEILKMVALERPTCISGVNMDIVKGELLREYLFESSRASDPEIKHTPSIEVYEFIWNKLPGKLQTYLKYKLSRENYNKFIAEKSGKVFGSAILKRKRWKKK